MKGFCISTAAVFALAGCAGDRSMPASIPGGATMAARQLLRNSSSDIIADVPQVSFRDEGKAAPGTTLTLALTLRYRNQAKLDRLVEDQSEVGSPQYRHWLTNEQFDAEFAPAASDYVRVTRSLQRAGIRVTQTYPNRTVIDAAGSTTTIEHYFATQIHRVSQPGYGERYVNVTPARAPSEFSGLLLSVDGLSTLTVVKPSYQTVRADRADRPRRLPENIGGGLFGPVSSVTGLSGYGPRAFAQGYDLPIQHTAKSRGAFDGSGRASGIVMSDDFLDSDLASYLAYFKIKRTGPAIARIAVDGGPSSNSTEGIETVLDVETLASLVPGAALYVYELPALNSPDITDAYNEVVSANKVDTLNSSFGGDELSVGASTAHAWDAIAEQGAAKGITFHAASGDAGGNLVNAPSSGAHVVAIGGTTLYVEKNGAWFSEIGWIGSTGGVSRLFPLPAWQKGVTGIDPGGRNVPDFAFDADPYTGTAVYFGGTWNSQYDPTAGTSLASPIFGAIITQVDQMQGGRMGLAAENLYKLWEKSGYGTGPDVLFHEITQGYNGVNFDGPNYNLVTGIGSLDAWNVAHRL